MSASTAPSLTLADYLEKLPGTTFRRLYQQPSTAFAIFRRMLTHLAKTIVMAVLYMPGPLPLDDLDTWVKPGAKRQRDQALSVLRRLHVVSITVPARDKPQELSLTANFRHSLRLALEGGGGHGSFGVESHLPAPAEVDVAFLDRYARKKWEDILHYVVNSVGMASAGHDPSAGPQASVKELLVAGRLVERRPGHAGVSITQSGFTFLLQEANAQVWTLLLQWLEAAADGPAAGADPVDMLSFLFMLGSLELGRAYDAGALTGPRRGMLPSLADFGLIYVPHGEPRQYFPTRLATTLTSTSSALRSVSSGFDAASGAGDASGALPGGPDAAAGAGRGSIILETNYRLYAYTSSPLQIAVLALFTQLKMRFAGMVSGRLTRDSIRRAISYGITSDQIIHYLATHAHEQMHRVAALQGRPVLPPTVVDQIRLWQLENERMKTTTGFLFKDFDGQKEYDALVQYADEIGVLVWRSDRKQMFFASRHEQLRDYLKLRKKAD